MPKHAPGLASAGTSSGLVNMWAGRRGVPGATGQSWPRPCLAAQLLPPITLGSRVSRGMTLLIPADPIPQRLTGPFVCMEACVHGRTCTHPHAHPAGTTPHSDPTAVPTTCHTALLPLPHHWPHVCVQTEDAALPDGPGGTTAAGHPPRSQALLGNNPAARCCPSFLPRSPSETTANQRGTVWLGPRTRRNCAHESHQRPPGYRSRGCFAADPTLSIFWREERGLPLQPLHICSVNSFFPPPGGAASPGPGLQFCFLFTLCPFPRALLFCHRNNHHLSPFRGFLQLCHICSHFLSGPRLVKSRLPLMCNHSLRSSVIHTLLVRLSMAVIPLPDASQFRAWGHSWSGAWYIGTGPTDGTASLAPPPAGPQLAPHGLPVSPFKICTSF